ncbi:MAG: M23 family metallopeptidase [Chloroflexi bacterium]|nr:MAG: M23 family metallopeptidase [Chloroflexota bacterium]
MSLSNNQDVTEPHRQQKSTGSVTTQKLPAPIITGPLTDQAPRITRQLHVSQPNTTTKLPTVIPATEKRPRVTVQGPIPQRHPVVFITALISSMIMIVLTLLFVSPLGLGQQQGGITQVFQNIFAPGSQTSFGLRQHELPPTPTPALLTNNGYCGGTDIWGICATAVTASGLMGTEQMQRPIVGATVTQVFANPEYQTWCGCVKPHSGIDLAAPLGTPITATDSGQVIWVGWDWSGLGWSVKINHGHYVATIYGHMASYIVKAGQNVMKGQLIGYEGSTGASTGPHLHFMVLANNIWLNPTQYMVLP